MSDHDAAGAPSSALRDDVVPMGPEDARSALERVIGGEAFARSRRNRDLLAHLANETLAGRADTLNGTTVAQDALGKGDDFDPASDPSVRVQMGRLRRLLETHYEAEGAADPVRIGLAKGSYVPTFTKVERPRGETQIEPAGIAIDSPPPGQSPSSEPEADAPPVQAGGGVGSRIGRSLPSSAAARAVAFALLALVVAALGALVAVTLRQPLTEVAVRDYPVVVVRAFENRTGIAKNDVLAAGLQRQFAADLQRFRTARVTLNEAPRDLAVPDAGADFTVTGAVLSADDTLDAIIWLIDAGEARIAATERLTIDATGDDYLDALEQFSARLTAHVAAPRGHLAKAAKGYLDDHNVLAAEGGLGAFECYARFNDFTANRTAERFAPIYDCLAGEAERSSNDGTLLAALGWMELLGSPEAGLMDPAAIGRDTSLARAVELVNRAVSVAPGNDVAHLYHGLINWFVGNEEIAIGSMRRAVRLNPADPQHKADYGMFLSYSGDWERGLRYAREAIDWDIDPPGWYFMPFYFESILGRDVEGAEAILAQGAVFGDPFEPIYRLVLGSIAGDQAMVERWRPAVMGLAEENEGDALGPLRRWVRLPEILSVMEVELRKAGIPVRTRAA